VNLDRDTPLLLPPDRRDWVAAGHWVHFAVDAMAATEVRVCLGKERRIKYSIIKYFVINFSFIIICIYL
jgi:hypothetical protein